nr:DUF2784 domain-containing protein [Pseudonocardia acidicola]
MTMATHFAFLVFLALGGFLAWWRRWLIVPHIGAVIWGLLAVTVGVTCPLTDVEDWARRRAGEQGLPRGFIDTYLTGVVYPAHAVVGIRTAMAAAIALSWIGLLVLVVRRRRARRATPVRLAATGRRSRT